MMFAYQQDLESPTSKLFDLLVANSIHADQQHTVYGFSQEGQRLLMLTQIGNPDLPTLMIVAGTHGDEIAGIDAAAKFWINEAPKYLNQVNLIYYPCVNPDGYNAGRRLTANNSDINREFHFETTVPEAKALILSMNRWGKAVNFLLHLHEDNPAHPMDLGDADVPIGSYLYLHGKPNHTFPIANRIIDQWQRSGYPIHHTDRLYGSAVSDGVINCTTDRHNPVISEAALLDNFVTSGEKCMSITVETLTTDDFRRRVAMQYDAIETTIRFLIKRPRLDQCYLYAEYN